MAEEKGGAEAEAKQAAQEPAKADVAKDDDVVMVEASSSASKPSDSKNGSQESGQPDKKPEAKGGGKGELADKQIQDTQEGTMMGFAAVAKGLRKGKGKGKSSAPSEATKEVAVKDAAAKEAGVKDSGELSGGITLQRAPSADFPQGLKLVRASSGDLPGPKKAKRWTSKRTLSTQSLEAAEGGTPNGTDGDQTPASASKASPGVADGAGSTARLEPVPIEPEPPYVVLLKEWLARNPGKAMQAAPSYTRLVDQWRRGEKEPDPEPKPEPKAVGPVPPPPKEEPEEPEALPPFVPSPEFKGAKRGYKFQVGPKGLGYYLDAVQDAPDQFDADKAQVPKTIYGLIFCQKEGEGCASYHFDSVDDCYISYTQPKEHWKLQNGMRPPEKKHFSECSYDEESRTFNATVHWSPTFLGDSRWEYEMGFAEDFSCIEEGTLTTYDTNGSQRKMLNFGMDLHYNRHVVAKLKLKAKAKAAPKVVEEVDEGPPAPPLKSLTLARLKFLAKYHNISTQNCLDIEDVIDKLSKAGVSDKMAQETPDEETLALRAAVRRKAWKPAFAPTPYNHGEDVSANAAGAGQKGRTPGCKFGHPMILDTRDSNFRSKRYCDMCRHFGTQYTCSQRPRCDYDMCSRCYEKGGHAVIGP